MQELLDSELLEAAGGGGKAGSSWSAIANEADGGCSARRSLTPPFTELRRTGQEAAKTELFEARAARHYARQHTGPARRNVTDLNLPMLRDNYVCSENSQEVDRLPLLDEKSRKTAKMNFRLKTSI